MELQATRSGGSPYFPELDALRFFAITGVLIYHYFPVAGIPLMSGNAGVELFFVLSGFLITQRIHARIESGEKGALKHFLIRRSFRILPLSLTVITASIILDIYPAREQWFFLVTFTYNYSAAFFQLPYNTLSHFWTLCVEEQFYLIWPAVFIALRSVRAILIVASAMIAFAWIQLAFSPVSFLQPFDGPGTHTRIAGLLIGSIGAVVYFQNEKFRLFASLKSMEILIPVCIAMLLISPRSAFTFPVLQVAFLLLVVKSVSGFKFEFLNTVMRNRAISYVGKISFGIYLLHPFVQYGINHLPGCSEIQLTVKDWNSCGLSTISLALLCVGISIALAAISYRFFEKPLLNMRDRVFPAPK